MDEVQCKLAELSKVDLAKASAYERKDHRQTNRGARYRAPLPLLAFARGEQPVVAPYGAEVAPAEHPDRARHPVR